MTDAVSRLLAHMAWADARARDMITRAITRAEDPPQEAIRIYAHVAGAEHTWLSRLQGRAPQVAVWPELDAAAAAALCTENVEALRGFAARLDDAGLEAAVSYTNSKGVHFESKVSDILLHVALHGSYHRGQIALLLRQHDSEPIATDYIVHARGS